MKVVIVDDVQQFVEILKHTLRKVVKRVKIIKTATSIAKAIAVIECEKPDLLLLDVHLDREGATALDLLKTLDYTKYAFKIIFVSAYLSSEEVVKRIETAGFELVSQPVDPNALQYAIQQTNLTSAKYFPEMMDLLFSYPQTKIAIKQSPSDINFVLKTQIVKIIQTDIGASVHLANGTCLNTNKDLSFYETLLRTDSFVWTNPKNLVNLQYMSTLDRKMGKLILKNGEKMPISRRYMTGIKANLSLETSKSKLDNLGFQSEYFNRFNPKRQEQSRAKSENYLSKLWNIIFKSSNR
ncbi:MAG: hypothetical protein RLZZ628_2171 [Bacteroidota bacterium]|jgi:two-component system LytT family response regulator